MKRLILIDGNALLHRAYHATPPLTTPKGELVNAVYGFSLMLLKALDDLKPDYVAIAWDEKGPTFRHQAYTQYKATRGPTDDGLSSQYDRVHQVATDLNMAEFKLSGYEADDLIGTMARQAVISQKDLEIIVLTGDRDIMQIIEPRVKVLMPKKTLSDVGLYGVTEFVERFGFQPIQLIDYKALAGDSSDNIPGVPGIGEVSATKLIKQFNSIEEIYKTDNLKTLPERMQKLLSEGAESAVMSKQLATIDLDAPIKLDLKKAQAKDFDHKKLIKLFEELDFKSLISRVNGGKSVTMETPPDKVVLPKNKATTNLDLEVDEVLKKMTKTGILVDQAFITQMGKTLKDRLATLEKEIYNSVGHEFNLSSPKQLGEVLFDELNLEVVRKTKTGRSTDEATLTELYDAHPAIPKILEYRQLFKLVSTYIDSLPRYFGEDGRIHSTFNVEGAATGRLSSQDPNLQNIPIRGTQGSELRKAFIAPKGKVMLGADYSQIELRIMAHLADDPGLKKAFLDGTDIHASTAARIFKIPVDQVSKEQRMVGKTMNFATLYGQGPRALSQQLKVDYATAKLYIEEYFAEYPKVKAWMQQIVEEGVKHGYVETIWGRRRYIPELQAANRMMRSAGERMAINMPIQGTQADMIKRAMIDIDKEIGDSAMILQVHDELLFECEPDQVEKLAKIVKEKMINALKLSIPVEVSLKTGKNWGELKPLNV